MLALTATCNAFAASPDIATDLARQTRAGRPTLLFFTLAGCPFCERARRSYLGPLAAGQGERLTVLEIPIEARLAGFDGKPVLGRELAQTYGVKVYPTVVVVDRTGRMLAEPLAGFGVPDFYGAQIDDRITTATNRLANPQTQTIRPDRP